MKQLSHNGIIIPKYKPVGLSLKIKGFIGEFMLSPLQEEMAVAFVKKSHLDCMKDQVFISNFLFDFGQALNMQHIQLEQIDFREVDYYISGLKAKKEKLSKEDKKKLREQKKKEREANKEKYGYATIDGEKVEIAAYRAEPAGIFMGRGQHPLRGRWKPAVRKEDIILNLSPKAPMPPGFVKREWDPDGRWIAKWNNNRKYVWLSESSRLRQKSEIEKYGKAKKLEKNINKVRLHILMNMKSSSLKRRKIATCCFLIDKLGLRVGDEKDEGEADTVGARTLRREHIRISGQKVSFDFLGKDSVKFQKTVRMPEAVVKNLRQFMFYAKEKGDGLFNGVSFTDVNSFLKEAMPGLTTKVFRTYLATRVVEDSLWASKTKKKSSAHQKKLAFKRSNLEAAKILNHKRKVPKNWEERIKKKEERVLKLLAKGTPASLKKADELKSAIDLECHLKEYNLNTSLRSYIDPRVVRRWAKKTETDTSKLYPKSLQKKFSWALESRTGKQNE